MNDVFIAGGDQIRTTIIGPDGQPENVPDYATVRSLFLA